MSDQPVKVIASNRKARHDYHIEDTFEAGIVLTGSEIKSIRARQVNLSDGYAAIRNGEVWLLNAHIAPYHQASYENHEPRRDRKLLMHRREINRLTGKLQEKGLTLIPLQIYLKNSRAKVELGLARGKKLHDKRESVRERDDQRQMARAMGRRLKGVD
ncbi:MAG: SsrA-binding protein SmpB [Anaerolineales bacterium]|nr:SsrA-binding protein SmpB [Anaerolineales bacterium]